MTLSIGPVAATVTKTLDLPELSQRAEVIADVTVKSVQSYWASPAGKKAIRTKATFSVNQLVKGQATATLTLDFPGGQVGGLARRVEGMPELQVGQHLILFSYSPDKNMVSPFVGFDQGVMQVIHDQESNVDRVYRWWGQPVSETEPFTSRKPIDQTAVTRESLRSASTVDVFLNKVRQTIGK